MWQVALFWLYQLAGLATFAYLTAQDAAYFNAWNWLVIVPVNMFLGTIWPAYWAVLHWI